MGNDKQIRDLLEAAGKLSLEDMRTLHRGLVELVKTRQRQKAAQLGAQFTPGQIVRFNAKRRGIKYLKIESFNRAGTAVKGPECDVNGNVPSFSTRWTVGTTLCTLVK
jgi:hypothetical protein